MRSICQPSTPDFSEFIGVPYEKMNCWDLAVAFYKNILGLSLENIYSGQTPERKETQNLIYSNVGEFERVLCPQFGDLVVIKIWGIESHIGIYLGNKTMLHTSKGHGSVIERLDKWKPRISGFYRVKNK